MAGTAFQRILRCHVSQFLSESAGGATHLLEDSQFLSLLYGLSTVLSYTEAGREGQPGTLSERARAVMSAQLGVMSAVTEERLGTLSSAIAEQVIVQMLLLAEQPCGMSAPPPFFR